MTRAEAMARAEAKLRDHAAGRHRSEPGCFPCLKRTNPYLYPPFGSETVRTINGQLCVWDADPEAEWGRVWLPVCPWCRRGPLNQGERTCGSCPPAAQFPLSWERAIFGADA